jgi:hypothetical protein
MFLRFRGGAKAIDISLKFVKAVMFHRLKYKHRQNV